MLLAEIKPCLELKNTDQDQQNAKDGKYNYPRDGENEEQLQIVTSGDCE